MSQLPKKCVKFFKKHARKMTYSEVTSFLAHIRKKFKGEKTPEQAPSQKYVFFYSKYVYVHLNAISDNLSDAENKRAPSVPKIRSKLVHFMPLFARINPTYRVTTHAPNSEFMKSWTFDCILLPNQKLEMSQFDVKYLFLAL